MKFKWYKQLSMLLVIALCVSILPIYSVANAETEITSVGDVQLEPVALTFYKKELDGSYSPNFTSVSDAYLNNFNVYEKDEKIYLRVIQLNHDYINFKTKLNGETGTVVESLKNNANTPDQVTHYVIDFEIPSTDQTILWNISYAAGPGTVNSHDAYVTINQDATDADREELTAAIAEAELIESKGPVLTQALAAAKEGNNAASSKVVLAELLANLKEAIALNAENGGVQLESVALTFYKKEDNGSYTPNFTSVSRVYLNNFNVYEKDEKTYLRIIQENSDAINFKTKLNGELGTVVDSLKNNAVDPNEVTHYVIDFEIPSTVKTILWNISYAAGPGRVNSHDAYVTINQDATDADREELTEAIAEAELIVRKFTVLTQALAAAKEGNNVTTRKAVLAELLANLEEAIVLNAEFANVQLEEVALTFYKHENGVYTPNYTDVSAAYLNDFNVYEKDGKIYLRIIQKNNDRINFKTKLNGETGTIVESLHNNVDDPNEVTHYVIDFEIPSKVKTILWNISYAAGPTRVNSHDAYVTINQDATDADREELTATIAEAELIPSKFLVLAQALAAAKEGNNATTRKAVLAELLANLEEAIVLNAELASVQLESVALTFYDDKYTPNFRSLVTAYLTDFYVYEKNGKTYLRVSQNNMDSLKFKTELNGETGTIVKNLYNDVANPEKVTHYMIDFEIPSKDNTIVWNVSYKVGNNKISLDGYGVINQDADEATRAALQAAIDSAEAVNNKGAALVLALNDAKAVNNPLSRKAVLVAKTEALVAAITANNTNPVTIHPGSGLEVGSYMIPLTILHESNNANSYMQSYVRDTARLIVTENSLTVHLLLGGSDMIMNFNVNNTAAAKINNYYDTVAKEYVARYSFNVNSISEITNSTIHVKSPIYDETHSIRISFGAPGVKLTSFAKDRYELAGDNTPPVPVVDEEEVDTEEENNNDSNNGGGSTTAPPQVKFNDIANSWAKENIERAVALNIVTGYADGSFKPNQVVNRAEFTAMIARALKLETTDTALQFKDNDKISNWAKGYIQAAVNAGIINGFEDQSFRPTEEISRTQVTVMMIKALGIEPSEQYELTFADADSIPAYARKYVAAAVELGLIAGVGNNTFAPNKAATRAEAITFNLRVLDYKPKQQ